MVTTVGGLYAVLEEIKVENVLIAKQAENSSEFEEFLNVVRSKNINIILVEDGQKLQIDKDTYIEIFHPSKELIKENALNNNSIVLKLNYKNFSVLFTGDIEEIAEKEILKRYKNLNSTVLKVAHHGSKTSSTLEFLNAVKPKIALIGVGEENNFGHPSDITLENLSSIGSKIYRTDLCRRNKPKSKQYGGNKYKKYILYQ